MAVVAILPDKKFLFLHAKSFMLCNSQDQVYVIGGLSKEYLVNFVFRSLSKRCHRRVVEPELQMEGQQVGESLNYSCHI
jgi:hypothetical protein